ncbi:hypothetical protein KCU71_g4264, partial [Aureobasidium melanogenum]
MSEIISILTGLCYLSNLIDAPLPWCASGASADTNQIVKALVATSKLGVANSNIAEGGIEQPYAESPLAKALQIIQSQPFPGLTALSEEELDKFLAGLEAPKLTTMLTVPVSMPTKRSTPEAVADLPGLSDEELKKYGFRREWYDCPTLMPIPCLSEIFASPTRLPPSDEFLARLDAPKPTKRSESTSASDHSSEEELEKTADEGPEKAGFFCVPFTLICL